MQKQSLGSMVCVFLVIMIVWAGYRYFFILPEWADEFIVKPLIYLLPLLIVKNSFAGLGITKNKFWFYVLLGLGLGILFLIESILVKFFKYGAIQMLTVSPSGLLFNLCIALATGFTEETVFRGYFFQRFMGVFTNEMLANIISSFMFTIIHLPLAIFSLHYSGKDLFMYCVQIYALGTIFAFVFARVKSIIPTSIAHAIWNFSNVFIK
ncbi:hypothetical protein A2363_02080 [Candidatus Gottesmanbacteria bacterium RIFOXYB1_FULL_47_11]|uniref:CAAX prenyl protease 2/Lysostaphin resistance protein A-like domain-containing protein n=1 Tax=Candidatus Gottesmanbacteria bacterium RIFOXYB1_FULL_47_11 TaxID=1798401 RepID=A0A1F6BEP0_9BACT|nr:MAG: hypothetical protein A2363_02080 [Candidatus Gottesmanbacteria bacterium RIFOXYB1_FULL_47_11]